MILVHEDMLNRYGQKQIETSPITTTMMHKDAEMSNALKCQMQQTDMTDDQKEKLFYANLECYLSLKQQKNSQVPTVQLAPIIANYLMLLLFLTVLKRMRERATAILNRLKTCSDIISWDNTGQVKIDSVSILQSNISDLISDAVRACKNFKPKGLNELFDTLPKMNMPRDLVRCETVLSGDNEPHRQVVTRQAKRPSPGIQTILLQVKRPRIALLPKWQTY